MSWGRHQVVALATAATIPIVVSGQQPPDAPPEDTTFVFRTGIELINISATVTDRRGRFVNGLTQDDFLVYEDDQPVEITHFNNDRIPVSLGIALDTSGSMDGRKMNAAWDALDRFLYDLLGPDDEVFVYEFNYTPQLVQDWTTNRDRLSQALRTLRPNGGTAMYDAVAESVPQVAEGRHRKKAVLVISDGNDTNSEIDVRELQSMIRENEALVYAIGIDGDSRRRGWNRGGPRIGIPPSTPLPFPGGGRRSPIPQGRRQLNQSRDDRVNVAALRDLTDDSGGRTEIIRDADDLDPATEGIARELNQQYYLGYPAQADRDGHWHSIRVEVKDRQYRVRARRGYTATP